METLQFEITDQVGVLTINRPKAMNALNAQVLSELSDFFDQQHDCRVFVITGSGDKAFVAGADIKEMQSHTAELAKDMAKKGQAVFSKIENLNKPVIAAVNGFALGGGMELALACNFIVASKAANFGLPEVSLGLIPGYGGTQRLSRSIGLNNARMVAMTGNIYGAEQAYDWGLVSGLSEPEELMSDVLKVAKKISQQGPLAVASAKKSIQEGFDKILSEGLELEVGSFGEIFKTEDHNEGISAFIEKRKPSFTGK